MPACADRIEIPAHVPGALSQDSWVRAGTTLLLLPHPRVDSLERQLASADEVG